MFCDILEKLKLLLINCGIGRWLRILIYNLINGLVCWLDVFLSWDVFVSDDSCFRWRELLNEFSIGDNVFV